MKKMNIKMILLLQVILFGIYFFFLNKNCGGIQVNILYFTDAFVFSSMLLFVGLSMLFTGTLPDFLKAFSVGQKQYRLLKLKDIFEAVSACQKIVLFGGLIQILTMATILLSEKKEILSAEWAVIFLPAFYVIFFEYLLLPLRMNIQKVINKEIDMDEL